MLPLTALALRLVSLRSWQRILARHSPVRTAGGDVSTARGVARVVDVAARRGPYGATCLPRSLTLWWLLRRRGIDPELRIGVRKGAGNFEAHAWVEFRGLVLNDSADVRERFAMFDRAILPFGEVRA
jgi:hypothetical protein